MFAKHPAYIYCKDVVDGKINAPKYVRKQCKQFINIANDDHRKYIVDIAKVEKIDRLLDLFIMAKGLSAGKTVKESLAGFQWFLIIASLCVVYRDNPKKRRYETVLLEICRKNGKTFLVALLFILLFFTEPRFSKFYSVAPDGSLSREVKSAMHDIISMSPALSGTYDNKLKFKLMRDCIKCQITDNEYIPLAYSTSRLDGRLANVFLVDEAGALPNAYPIEAMRSGQLTILNKLGFVISTKYPTIQNPFEDEVAYAKKILDEQVEDDTVFALLYEPDNILDWSTDDNILEQANPLALEVTDIMDDLKKKRQQAIEVESKRENFITKHCNIIYQGVETESYISLNDLIACKSKTPIQWKGKEIFVGVDLSMSNDNCAVGMASYNQEEDILYIGAKAFIPEDKIDEKNKFEKINYNDFIKDGTCVACGDRIVDYSVIEDYVFGIDSWYGTKMHSLGFDRYNAISSAQKWEKGGIVTVEIKQHSSLLHSPTKWLAEMIEKGRVRYDDNKLLEINFNNARCQYDTNMNRYVNKKKSNGKVDMVVAIINAVSLELYALITRRSLINKPLQGSDPIIIICRYGDTFLYNLSKDGGINEKATLLSTRKSDSLSISLVIS